MPKTAELAMVPLVERIFEVRRQKVILDSDLATAYGVETRALNQAVKRNSDRFPNDFAFQLEVDEVASLWRSRSQSVILKRGSNVKHRPWAFTEHGAIMAASVLNSTRAVEMSVYVVRAFVRLRGLARPHSELARQLAALERRVSGHDEDLAQVLRALRALLEPTASPRRRIGFAGKAGQ